MKMSMRMSRRMIAGVMLASLALTACGSDDDTAETGDDDTTQPGDDDDASPTDTETEGGGTRVEGGTVVFGAEQEPVVLNTLTTEGNRFSNGLIAQAVQEGAYMITPDFQYVPQLIDGEAEVTEDPFTVTYNIKQDAAWPDGTPVSADDFIFTWETNMNEDYDITSREGYDKITEAEAVDEKTVTFTFSEPYAPYRTIFSPILPKHLLEGEDFDTVWNETIAGSGPFQLEEWNKGQTLTLVRNENYWGEPAALERVVIKFVLDAQTMLQQLEGGEIDAFYPQPQVDLVERVDQIEGVEYEAGAGPVWEHMDFQQETAPLLANLYVREAIALGTDRQSIVDTVVAPIKPDAEVLQNAIYVGNQPEYEPHFDKWSYDPEAAKQKLEENGCTQGDDGIYECDGERLSFNLKWATPNEGRTLQGQIIQANLKEIGIEIIDDSGEDAFDFLPSEEYEIFTFAWVGNPDPGGNVNIFKSDGGQNWMGYVNEEVDSLLEQTNTTIDAQARADLFNQVDELLSQDLPLLPLYQKPTFFAWRANIEGPQDNATTAGPFWNIGEWYLTE